MEEKINGEPENKYVDKQQSHSLKAMEEQVQNPYVALAINAVKEVA